MDIDTPLDEVISKKRQDRRNSSRKSASSRRPLSSTSARARSNTANVRSAGTGQPTSVSTQPTQGLPSDAAKIVVSNLPDDVLENQIKELFESTIGPIKRVNLSYNSSGRSTGNATVEFRRMGDGSKACTQYNGRLIDNNRPMKVEIIVDPARIPKPPLSTRVAPPAKETAPAAASTNGRGSGAGRGRGGRGKGKGTRAPREKTKSLTAEELDAQMDAYVADGAGSTEAAAAA